MKCFLEEETQTNANIEERPAEDRTNSEASDPIDDVLAHCLRILRVFGTEDAEVAEHLLPLFNPQLHGDGGGGAARASHRAAAKNEPKKYSDSYELAECGTERERRNTLISSAGAALLVRLAAVLAPYSNSTSSASAPIDLDFVTTDLCRALTQTGADADVIVVVDVTRECVLAMEKTKTKKLEEGDDCGYLMKRLSSKRDAIISTLQSMRFGPLYQLYEQYQSRYLYSTELFPSHSSCPGKMAVPDATSNIYKREIWALQAYMYAKKLPERVQNGGRFKNDLEYRHRLLAGCTAVVAAYRDDFFSKSGDSESFVQDKAAAALCMMNGHAAISPTLERKITLISSLCHPVPTSQQTQALRTIANDIVGTIQDLIRDGILLADTSRDDTTDRKQASSDVDAAAAATAACLLGPSAAANADSLEQIYTGSVRDAAPAARAGGWTVAFAPLMLNEVAFLSDEMTRHLLRARKEDGSIIINAIQSPVRDARRPWGSPTEDQEQNKQFGKVSMWSSNMIHLSSPILGHCRDHTIVPSTPVGEPMEMTEWSNKHRSIPKPSNCLLTFFFDVGKEAFERTLIIIDRCLVKLVGRAKAELNSKNDSPPPSNNLVHLSNSGMLLDSPANILACNLKGVLSLYYSTLNNVLEGETRRLGGQRKHPGLIWDESFHRALFAICAEVGSKLHNKGYPHILEGYEIEPSSYIKMVEIFVRTNSEIPKEIRQNLKEIEDKIMDFDLWAKNGSFCKSIKGLQLASTPDKCLWPPAVLVQDSDMKDLKLPSPATEKDNPSARAVAFIFRRIIRVTAKQIQDLTTKLALDKLTVDCIWSTWKHFLSDHIHLLAGRHMTQFIICTIYGVCRISEVKEEVTFKKIIKIYREINPKLNLKCYQLFNNIEIEDGSPIDLVHLYNEYFLAPPMSSYILKFKNLRDQQDAMALVSSVVDAKCLLDTARTRLRQNNACDEEGPMTKASGVDIRPYNLPSMSVLPRVSTGTSIKIEGSNLHIFSGTAFRSEYNLAPSPKKRTFYRFGISTSNELSLVNRSINFSTFSSTSESNKRHKTS
mmetsp:Transcript_42143/g.98772  ORF Transcript_42143/g.98772 Transcript_42143/m.98772 type:complete len:1053 (-) Transcript_42143:373-3531(-)